jgi:4-amino-4-deoxy-L-arabinose transferase-like glycosyltransferase
MSASSLTASYPAGLRNAIVRDLALPIGVALTLRLLLLLVPVVPTWDGSIYERGGAQIAAGEGYTVRIFDPDARPHATAFYPVGYPAVVAATRLMGGGRFADRIVQSTATLLLVPAAYFLARRARGRRAGRYAAWLAALWPGGVFLSATWLSEPVFALLLALSVLPVAYARRRRRLEAYTFAALILGLASYVRPSALPMAAVLGFALGWLFTRCSGLRGGIVACGMAAAFTLISCVPLLPWVLRNQRVLRAPVLVSTNGGVNLLLGAQENGSFKPIPDEHPCKRAGHGEVERDRCFQRSARQIITREPFTWLGRGLIKLAHTVGHDSASAQCFAEGLRAHQDAREALKVWSLGLSRVFWMPLLALILWGARRMVGVIATSTIVLLAPIAAILALHSVYLGGDRYLSAVAPMFLALDGIGLASLQGAAVRSSA